MPYTQANYDFTDCVAVVTGGNGGIGAAISAMLTQAGATVVCWDLQTTADSPYRQRNVDHGHDGTWGVGRGNGKAGSADQADTD